MRPAARRRACRRARAPSRGSPPSPAPPSRRSSRYLDAPADSGKDGTMGTIRGIAVAAIMLVAIAPARAMTEEEERAKAHFLAGQSYYDQASYNDALREFNEAYR